MRSFRLSAFISLAACSFVQLLLNKPTSKAQVPTNHIMKDNYDATIGPIPHNLIFTYKTNILETKEPLQFYNNVMNTIQAYRKEWNEPNAPVYFLTDDNCTDLLKQVDQLENTTLLRACEEYTFRKMGEQKADICRLAALYLYGGYYFDIDIEVIQPIRLDPNISFSTSHDAWQGVFFQAFLATTRAHPMIRKNFQVLMDNQKFGSHGKCHNTTELIGPCTLMEAWNTFTNRTFHSRLLHEKPLSVSDYPNVTERPGGMNCNYIVHDATEKVVYFYSRIVKSRYCSA